MDDSRIYQAFMKLIKSQLLKEDDNINSSPPATEESPDNVIVIDKTVDTTLPEESLPSTIIKKFKTDEQISVEIVYEPEVLDAHGEWMSADTIEKAKDNFNKNLASGNAKPNLFHLAPETEKLEILKTYTMPCECTIGETVVKSGTWVAEVKWHDDLLWKQRTVPNEDGVLAIAGLSMQGMGNKILPKESATHVDKTQHGKAAKEEGNV